ncbi:MAG: tetratricopeptide repeat protein [Alphaproteobacteria bacterium]
MGIDQSLPFVPEPASWPLAPMYTGKLDADALTVLKELNLLHDDDDVTFNQALDKLKSDLSLERISDFFHQFSYRCYTLHGNSYAAEQSTSVRRLYRHPYLKLAETDVVVELDVNNIAAVRSMLNTNAIVCHVGDEPIPPSLHELWFDYQTRKLKHGTYGHSEKFKPVQFVSKHHAQHYFEWQRAIASQQSFEYVPEDISQGSYRLYEYTTQAEQYFVQYFDKTQHFKFHSTICDPDEHASKTPEQLAEIFGYKRVYVTDVVVPAGHKITAWAAANGQRVFAYTIESTSGVVFPNEKRLLPAELEWKPGQKERYDQAMTIYQDGNYSYQGILDLYDPDVDNDSAHWCVLMGIAYSNPRDEFFDEAKAYEFAAKAYMLGDGTAASNLGVYWNNGLYGRRDIEKARLWYSRAMDADNGTGAVNLFGILKSDSRYKSDLEFKKEADRIFGRARQLGGYNTRLTDAQYSMSNVIGQEDRVRGLSIYEELATTTEINHQEYVDAIRILALRYYLGLDVPRDLNRALSYLDRMPLDKGDNIISQQTRNTVLKLRRLIEEELEVVEIKAWRDPRIIDADAIAKEEVSEVARLAALKKEQSITAPSASHGKYTSLDITKKPLSEDDVKGIFGLMGAGVLAVGGICYGLWLIRDEVVTVAGGLALTGAAYKVSHDFDAQKITTYSITGLTLLGTGLATYLTATSGLPQGTVTSAVWEHVLPIATGISGAIGSYVVIRDQYQKKFSIDTILKGGIAALAAAGSLYLNTRLLESEHITSIGASSAMPDAFITGKQISVHTRPDNNIVPLKCGDKVTVPFGIEVPETNIVLSDDQEALVDSHFLSYSKPSAQQCAL